MNENSLRTIASGVLPEGCLSDLKLDRLRCSDLSVTDEAAAEGHLQVCERCRERAQRLAAESEQLAPDLPELSRLLADSRAPAHATSAMPAAPHVPTLRKAGRSWAPVLAAFSVAAALVLFLGRAEPPAGEIRLKGVSGELDVFVKRSGKVFRWQSETLQPGDQLRYSFRAPEPLHVMVLSREADGTVNQYFPAKPSSFAVDMGVTLSKDATELDGRLGVETLWAVFCQKPFAAEPLLRELETGGAIPPAEGCATQRLEFTKATAPGREP